MAQRKSKKVREAAEETARRLKEMNDLLLLAEKEEEDLLLNVEDTIKGIAEKNGLFCGVILTHDDLISVLQLALKTGEKVKIPFRLYFNE